MENFDVNKSSSDRNLDKPIPFDNSVSHAPLDLGGGGAAPPKIERPAMPPSAMIKPAEKVSSSAERITGVKTFFTKLHGGAIEFLDEVVAKWLKENPGVSIKHTNVITGEIQGKKTEPNLIVIVWY
ncbi:MAG: hypothetical protein WC454_10455 [Phycisphaerae bacterium]|jgi:hypothetical protein